MKVWIVQCSDKLGGYVLGVYEDEADAIERKISADRATLCAPHDVLMQWTIARRDAKVSLEGDR